MIIREQFGAAGELALMAPETCQVHNTIIVGPDLSN